MGVCMGSWDQTPWALSDFTACLLAYEGSGGIRDVSNGKKKDVA